MVRALQIAALALLLAAAALCAFGCWFIYQLEPKAVDLVSKTTTSIAAIGDEAKSAQALTDNANGLIVDARPKINASLSNLQTTTANLTKASAGIDVAVAEINRPCGGDESCGTIATLNRAINSFRMAVGQVTAISQAEKQQRVLMNAQETQLANDSHAALVKLGTAIDSITTLASNKDLSGTFTKLNDTMGSLNGMAQDTATAWHDFLHPKWPKRVENAVQNWASAVAKFFVP